MNSGYEGGSRSQARTSLRVVSEGTGGKLARVAALFGLAAAALLSLSVAEAESGGMESLDPAVVEEMGVESNASERSLASIEEEGRTQVNVMRTGEEENWAFGSAVIEAPNKKGHYPEGWLFVAENTSEGWNVALEGSPEFSDLAAKAPEEVVSDGEQETFADQSSRQTDAGTQRTGLRLPWKKGKVWKFTGGPHGWSTGYDRPYAALDFAGRGGDQRVRAAGQGRVYKMCSSNRGWIRIYHPNGYSTDYYHLTKNIRPKNGRKIERGAYLGLTGNDVSCGGRSYGRHVHFALLKNKKHVRVHGKVIGGWEFIQGQAYRGYAQRGKNKQTPGGFIKNFGP
ncbi:MAG: M23 family metallopeptidase [Rubrobacteraceae bacterium]